MIHGMDPHLSDEVVPGTFEVGSGEEAVASFWDGLVGGVGEIRASGEEALEDAPGGELRASALQELPEVALALGRERSGYGGVAAHDPARASVVQLRLRVCHFGWHLRLQERAQLVSLIRWSTFTSASSP